MTTFGQPISSNITSVTSASQTESSSAVQAIKEDLSVLADELKQLSNYVKDNMATVDLTHTVHQRDALKEGYLELELLMGRILTPKEINLVKTEMFPEIDAAFKSLERDISSLNTATKGAKHFREKITETIQGSGLKKLAAGKAKLVESEVAYVKISDKTVDARIGDVVYYRPVTGVLYLIKKKEILEEAATAKSIKTFLEEHKTERSQSKIEKLCKTVGLTPSESGQIAKNYRSVDQFLEALSSYEKAQATDENAVPPAPLNKESAGKILAFVNDTKANSLIMDNIRNETPHINLEIELEDTTRPFGADNRFITPKGDELENVIRNKARFEDPKKNVSTQESASMAYQFLEGMADIHRTGRVQGDLKTENGLVYPNGVAITDFGKTQLIGTDEFKPYRGNPRNQPTEGLLSQKGEVQSTAFNLIRILEEQFLNKEGNPLLFPGEGSEKGLKKSEEARKQRRGFERFSTTNKKCPQMDSAVDGFYGTLKCTVGRTSAELSRMDPTNPDARLNIDKDAEAEYHKYVDALTFAIAGSVPMEDVEKRKAMEKPLAELNSLLKDMMNADPKMRPTMEQALARFPLELLQK